MFSLSARIGVLASIVSLAALPLAGQSTELQLAFQHGVAALHERRNADAEREFRNATRLEPICPRHTLTLAWCPNHQLIHDYRKLQRLEDEQRVLAAYNQIRQDEEKRKADKLADWRKLNAAAPGSSATQP